ncbi:MAG: hypothetical protein IKK45_06915 [Akkermansia sp.]|nr:hypothetical protein [Akkermansia sp.]
MDSPTPTPDTPTPRAALGRRDVLLLRWAGLCITVLGMVTVLGFTGLLAELELEQIRFLGGHPFYIDAEAAQVSLLEPQGLFLLCVGVCLYLNMLLLREKKFSRRLQLALLFLLALGLPGLLCVLWDGVLNMSGPMLCTLLCYSGSELLHLFPLPARR